MHTASVNEQRRQAAIWASRHRVLTRLFAAAADRQLDLLVFKGVHLAYSFYPDVTHRECADVDLLVRPGQQARVRELLDSLGFVWCATNTGDTALGQMTYELPRVPGSVLDVHSRIVASFTLAKRFAFTGLWERSVTFASFPSNVRVPSNLDALEIALVHHAAHHRGERVPTWTYDVHLLLQSLNEAELDLLSSRLNDGTLLALCSRLLVDAQQQFPSDQGRLIVNELADTVDAAGAHPFAARDRFLSYLADLRTLTPRHAARVITAHLFPASAYMTRTYAPQSRLPLPLLYALRIVRGIRQVVTAPSAG